MEGMPKKTESKAEETVSFDVGEAVPTAKVDFDLSPEIDRAQEAADNAKMEAVMKRLGMNPDAPASAMEEVMTPKASEQTQANVAQFEAARVAQRAAEAAHNPLSRTEVLRDYVQFGKQPTADVINLETTRQKRTAATETPTPREEIGPERKVANG